MAGRRQRRGVVTKCNTGTADLISARRACHVQSIQLENFVFFRMTVMSTYSEPL